MKYNKVSIIITVYNIQNYISRCIDSVIRQSYKFIEIIIVDDGSTDFSSSICDSYKLKDKRITIIHQKNEGPGSARNAGINIATGDFIMFIDGDDYINSQTIYQLLYLQRKYNSDLVLYGIRYINEQGKNIDSSCYAMPSNKMWNMMDYWQNYYKYPSFCVVPWNKLYKKSIFKNLRYENVFAEDEFIIHKIIEKCNNITILHKHYYYHTQRSDSITRSVNENNLNQRRLSLYELYSMRLSYLLSKKIFCVFNDTCSKLFSVFSMFNFKKMTKVDIIKFKRISKNTKKIFLRYLPLLIKHIDKKNKKHVLLFYFSYFFKIIFFN